MSQVAIGRSILDCAARCQKRKELGLKYLIKNLLSINTREEVSGLCNSFKYYTETNTCEMAKVTYLDILFFIDDKFVYF